MSIKGTPWSPDHERAGDVNSVRIPPRPEAAAVRVRQILTHQSSRRRLRPKTEVFQRFGLTAHCQEIEKEPEGASKDARDRERIKRARREPET